MGWWWQAKTGVGMACCFCSSSWQLVSSSMNNRCVIANGFGPTHLPPFPFNFKLFHGLIPAIAVSGFGSSGQGKLLERSSSSLRLKFVVSAELSKQFSSIGLDSHVCIIVPIPNVPFIRQLFFTYYFVSEKWA